ncbi:hypothetical protein SAMN05519104_6685 [Rhizobiales bacterium GAS188]|nr:hypothetical protein SAMN05519104_6685 [Rhizobiales bacterium GAS188]
MRVILATLMAVFVKCFRHLLFVYEGYEGLRSRYIKREMKLYM